LYEYVEIRKMPTCPHCSTDAQLKAGVLLDTVTGQKGYGCDECNTAYSTGELKRLGAL